MRITLLVLLFLIVCAVEAGKGQGNGKGPKKDPEWYKRFGMSDADDKETRKCMKELRKKAAMKKGKALTDDEVDDSPILDDIVFTPEQCQMAVKSLNNARRRRQIIDLVKYWPYKWTNPVVYEYDDNFPSEDQQMVNAAMAHWEANTCLRFAEYDPAVHDVEQYRVMFTYDSTKGCYSNIGCVGYFGIVPQPINLSAGCSKTIGTPVHEIGHALGLFHQQMRPDSAQYVKLNIANIKLGAESNFDLTESSYSTNYGVPYDIGSVMHYASRSFATDCNQDVLTAVGAYNEYTMGQRGYASFMDHKLINQAYCTATCTNTLAQACENGGYQDPNNCNKCKCPEGLGGDFCEGAGGRSPGCSPVTGVLMANATEQCVTSPNYGVSEYSIGDECSWKIQAPTGQKVKAYFQDTFQVFCPSLQYGSNSGCTGTNHCYHWVEIKYKADKQERGGRFCCYGGSFNDPGDVISEDEVMVVHFDAGYPQKSISGTFQPYNMYGFKLCYTAYTP